MPAIIDTAAAERARGTGEKHGHEFGAAAETPNTSPKIDTVPSSIQTRWSRPNSGMTDETARSMLKGMPTRHRLWTYHSRLYTGPTTKRYSSRGWGVPARA